MRYPQPARPRRRIARDEHNRLLFSELQIHIDLSGGFGRELGDFQLDQHIGVQNLVVEHHSHIVVGVIHRNALLCADKHESPAKFQQRPQDFVFLFIIGSYAMRVTKNKTPNGLSFFIIRSVDGIHSFDIEKPATLKFIRIAGGSAKM